MLNLVCLVDSVRCDVWVGYTLLLSLPCSQLCALDAGVYICL